MKESNMIIKLDWAINSIRDKLLFGRDELGAAKAREMRAKGVMIDATKYIKDLEAKNAELEIEAKKYQLLYRNSLISLVDKDIEIDKVEAKNIELEKKLKIAVKLLTSLRGLIELSIDSEHNYESWLSRNKEALAAINSLGK